MADFGKARLLMDDSEDMTTSIEGTKLFFSPECCSFDVTSYSMKKADIWALGVTIYCLTFNKLPFRIGTTELEIMDFICHDELRFDSERNISINFKHFLESML